MAYSYICPVRRPSHKGVLHLPGYLPPHVFFFIVWRTMTEYIMHHSQNLQGEGSVPHGHWLSDELVMEAQASN